MLYENGSQITILSRGFDIKLKKVLSYLQVEHESSLYRFFFSLECGLT